MVSAEEHRVEEGKRMTDETKRKVVEGENAYARVDDDGEPSRPPNAEDKKELDENAYAKVDELRPAPPSNRAANYIPQEGRRRNRPTTSVKPTGHYTALSIKKKRGADHNYALPVLDDDLETQAMLERMDNKENDENEGAYTEMNDNDKPVQR